MVYKAETENYSVRGVFVVVVVLKKNKHTERSMKCRLCDASVSVKIPFYNLYLKYYINVKYIKSIVILVTDIIRFYVTLMYAANVIVLFR